MRNPSNKPVDTNLQQLVNQTYVYGFSTKIENDIIQKGLNEETIQLISKKKNETQFLLNFRLKAFQKWKQMPNPEWPYLKFPEINYQDIVYYSAPKVPKKLKNLNEIDPVLLNTFEKLGISLTEQKRLANVAIDAVFDSVSIATTFQMELQQYGVIFSSISDAMEDYSKLIETYLGSVVPMGDNYFSALNSVVFTDGSFCYIPRTI